MNGTSSQATPSEAWWRTRSIVTRRSSGRRCGLERWRGNELNTELGARYSTRWLRSGCPIRTAPGDSATGTGRSAICSGPCNNAAQRCEREGWRHRESRQGSGARFSTPCLSSALGMPDSEMIGCRSTWELRRGQASYRPLSELCEPRSRDDNEDSARLFSSSPSALLPRDDVLDVEARSRDSRAFSRFTDDVIPQYSQR